MHFQYMYLEINFKLITRLLVNGGTFDGEILITLSIITSTGLKGFLKN